MNNSIFKCKDFTIEDIIYALAYCVVTLRISVRLFQQIKHFDYVHYQDISLWIALAGVFLFHAGLMILCFCVFKSKFFSGCFLYFSVIFALYTAGLVFYCFGFSLPPGLMLWLLLVLIVVLIYIPRGKIVYKQPAFVIQDLLIFLWFVHSLFLCLDYNFDPSRLMYQDEATFWAVAANNMVEGDVLKAHLGNYPGGGLHPFGVPFITALPMLLFPSIPAAGIFFMPVVVILSLLFFLNHIKQEKWVFLFFLVALFVSFNNRSWAGSLMYQLVYGEGISSVILLWFIYEIFGNGVKFQKVYLLIGGFCIGLLALTKSPLTLTVFPLLIIFLIKNRKQHSLGWLAATFVLAWMPSLVWKCFMIKFNIHYLNIGVNIVELASRFLKPNTDFIFLAFKHLWSNAYNLVFFGIFSLILWISFIKKFWEGLPAVFLLLGVIFYYAYVYGYGSIADYESFLRYVMPAFLILFWLGGVGLKELFHKIQSSSLTSCWKNIFIFLLTVLFIHRLF